MPDKTDTELLMKLIQNEDSQAPGFKVVVETLKSSGKTLPFSWNPSYAPPYANSESPHMVGSIKDSNIFCHGCGQCIDPDVCWCGESPESHNVYFNNNHPFIAMGCDCHRDRSGPQHAHEKPLEPDPITTEWDIL